MGIVVIPVPVPFTEDLGMTVPEIILEVILDLGLVGSEVAVGEIVYVDVIVSAEEVRKYLVVGRAVDLGVESAVDLEPVPVLGLP